MPPPARLHCDCKGGPLLCSQVTASSFSRVCVLVQVVSAHGAGWMLLDMHCNCVTTRRAAFLFCSRRWKLWHSNWLLGVVYLHLNLVWGRHSSKLVDNIHCFLPLANCASLLSAYGRKPLTLIPDPAIHAAAIYHMEATFHIQGNPRETCSFMLHM